MTAGAAAEATPAPARPRDFAVLLPPGWARLPADGTAEAAVARLLSLRLAGLPAREREQARHALSSAVLRVVGQAREAGALEVLLNLDPVRGRPVSAACVVSYLPPGAAEARVSSADLVPGLDEAGVHAVTLVPVGGEMAVRRLQSVPEVPGELPASVRLDHVVPVPHTGGAHLVLAFSTTTTEVADELVLLFDAIAGSLRWVP